MISIIVPLKDRFPQFQRMVRSLVKAELERWDVELLVVDHASDDGDPGEACKAMNLPAGIIDLAPPFNRSRALNEGVKVALGDTYFFLDADMIVPPEAFERIRRVAQHGTVWFPECEREDERGNIISDHHCTCGYGICAISREDFEKVGGWDEKFTAWGYDDVDFKERCEKAGLGICRERLKGLIHQWHPNTWEHRNKHTAHPGATSYMREGKMWIPH